ncbi:MAG: fatty acid cis/trans isomerase [Fibrobacterales bacterium]
MIRQFLVTYETDLPKVYDTEESFKSWYSEESGDSLYYKTIEPIFAQRCVSCHGCYEAPCQLNMQTYSGVRRGYNPTPIYNMDRYAAMPITQMNDIYPHEKWRSIGFQPVVNHAVEAMQSGNIAEWNASLMKEFLENSTKTNKVGFHLTEQLQRTNRRYARSNKYQCVATDEQFNEFYNTKENNPWDVITTATYFKNHKGTDSIAHGASMPFALPSLDSTELEAINTWLAAGAPSPTPQEERERRIVTNPEVLAQWEDFLNRPSAQAHHIARFIYEHSFTAYYHFTENPGEYFKLTRFAPLDNGTLGELVTELPYQTGINQPDITYLFKKVVEIPVHKKMIVWKVDSTKLARIDDIFDTSWDADVIHEPVYESNNPFEYFSVIPAKARYQFMIENSDIIIGAMIQGGVCVGSGATYAIKDHFWIWFLNPESDVSVLDPQLGLPNWKAHGTGRNQDSLALNTPAQFKELSSVWSAIEGVGENIVDGKAALSYLKNTHSYKGTLARAYESRLRRFLRSKNRTGLSVSDLWDGVTPGDSTVINQNAWLNITRHERNSSLQYGPEGGTPGSVWVLSFVNFERLYYNLVANYLPNGDLAMKVSSFRIMSYVRLEAEDLALSFLPKNARKELRKQYTKGLGWVLYDKVHGMESLASINNTAPRSSGDSTLINHYKRIAVSTPKKAADSLQQLFIQKGSTYLQPVIEYTLLDDTLSSQVDNWEHSAQKALTEKTFSQNQFALPQYAPNNTLIKITDDAGKSYLYSLVNNKSYRSNLVVSTDTKTVDPIHHSLSLYRGVVGAYPNVFLEIPQNELDQSLTILSGINTEQKWKAYIKKYGIARNSGKFWPFYDWIHQYKNTIQPGIDPVIHTGYLDLGQYDFF